MMAYAIIKQDKRDTAKISSLYKNAVEEQKKRDEDKEKALKCIDELIQRYDNDFVTINILETLTELIHQF